MNRVESRRTTEREPAARTEKPERSGIARLDEKAGAKSHSATRAGQTALVSDGKSISQDGMATSGQNQTPTMSVVDSGLQGADAGNPFQSLNLSQAQQLNARPLQLAGEAVDLGVELEFEPDVLSKLLSIEKRALKDGAQARRSSQILRAGGRLREASMLLVSDASVASDSDESPAINIRDAKTLIAAKVIEFSNEVRLLSAKRMKNVMFAHRSAFPMGMDVHAFVRAVLREAYMLQNEELLDRGRKMKELNRRKKELRRQTRRAEELKSALLRGRITEAEMEELAELLGFELGDPSIDAAPPQLGDSDSAFGTVADATNETTAVLSADASAYLDGIEGKPLTPPAGYHDVFRLGAALSQAGQSHDYYALALANWMQENPGGLESAMGAVSFLPPDQFANLVNALQHAQAFMDHLDLNNGEAGRRAKNSGVGDWRRALDYLRSVEAGNAGVMSANLKALLANAAPEQIVAIQTDVPHGLGTIRGMVADFDHRVAQAKWQFDASLPEGSPVRHWLGIFEAHGLTDNLLYAFANGETSDQLSFLARVGPELLANSTLGAMSERPHVLKDTRSAVLRADKTLVPRLFDSSKTLLEELHRSRSGASPTVSEPSESGEALRALLSVINPAVLDDAAFRAELSWLDANGSQGASDDTSTVSQAPGAEAGSDEPVGARPELESDTFYQHLMTDEEKEEFLDNKLRELEDESESIGFDQQMMQMELQDLMQKQQQFLTMMTNMSKMIHDVAMSIVRNIGG